MDGMPSTSRPAPEAVIFDWGGTLTPWHAVDLPRQWRVFAREVHGLPVEDPNMPVEELAEADSLAVRIHAAEERAWARGRETHESASIEAILAEAGIDPAHDRHHLALAAYRGFWEPHTHTDPQVRPLWEGLHDRGLKVGVLSNTLWSRQRHEDIFARDGILDLLDGAVYTSEIPWTKPHPEAFLAAMKAAGASDPSRCVFVGDRLFDDVWGAQNVGMRAIHVPHSAIPANQIGHTVGEPDATVQRLAELPAIVDGWNDAAA